MPGIHRMMAILSLLIVVAFASGCYTIVGYAPEAEKAIVEEEAAGSQIYRDYDYLYYNRPYSYYQDYYDPYYGLWYPHSYYDYWYRPWWRYYDDYYYRDYDEYYVPQNKPETKRRGALERSRSYRPESKRESMVEEDEEKSPLNREVRDKRRVEDKPVRKLRDSLSESKRRSTKRGSQDEGDK